MLCKYCGKTIKVAGENCPGCGKKIDALQGGNGYFGVVNEMDMPDNGLNNEAEKYEAAIKQLQTVASDNSDKIDKNSKALSRNFLFQIAFIVIALLLIAGMVVIILNVNAVSTQGVANTLDIVTVNSDISAIRDEVKVIGDRTSAQINDEESSEVFLPETLVVRIESMNSKVKLLEDSGEAIQGNIDTLIDETNELAATVEESNLEDIKREAAKILNGLTDMEEALKDYKASVDDIAKEHEALKELMDADGEEITDEKISKLESELTVLESNSATFDALCIMYGSELKFIAEEAEELLKEETE